MSNTQPKEKKGKNKGPQFTFTDDDVDVAKAQNAQEEAMFKKLRNLKKKITTIEALEEQLRGPGYKANDAQKEKVANKVNVIGEYDEQRMVVQAYFDQKKKYEK